MDLVCGDGFLVRTMVPEDEDDLLGILSDPETMRCIEPPMDRSAVRGFMEACAFSDPPRVYALADETGRLVGQVIFHPWDDDAWEIGWILSGSVRGQGLAERVTEALIGYGRSRGIRSFILEADPEQTVTRHIAEKLGFADQGILDGLAVFEKRT